MESDLTRNSPPATEVQTEPKQSNFLVILLSSLLIISCIIAGFFAYQTQKLVKELTAYRLQPTATQTPTPTPDPTADWKTYISKVNNYSFKIPENFIITEDEDKIEVFLDQPSLDKNKVCKPDPKEIEPLPCSPFLLSIFYKEVLRKDYQNGENYVNTKQGGMGGNPPYQNILGQNLIWTVGEAAGVELRPTVRAFSYDKDKIRFVETNTYVLPFWEYTHKSSSNDWVTATSQTNWDEIEKLTYQILSTFKFIEPVASSSPVACTMEAKICPDGTSVGRSGLKCEFIPCPTPKN